MNDTLNKRYFYKFFVNFFGLFIGLLTQMITLRGLGPQSYGNFNFLTNFFTQVVGFFHMGTPMAFFTKLSQRQKDHGLVLFYSYFTGIVVLLTFTVAIVAHWGGLNARLWPGQEMTYVYFACIFALCTWIIAVLYQMVDAYGVTVSAEKYRFIQMLISFILIGAIFILHKLNLMTFFFVKCFALGLLILFFIHLIRAHKCFEPRDWRLSIGEYKKYVKEFYVYTHPLFVYMLVAVVVGILDNWLLQFFGGGIQQGFYGLSYQIGAICFLFSSAMTPLITREFSIAYENKDLALMAKLFRKYIPLLYSITAFIACFVAVNADKITVIMGGRDFKGATTAVAIMAFYPIHQTYGQLSNSVYFATGQTRLYRNIGIIFNFIGLFLVYFLIAPKELFGINAGANGLAFKMVLMNILIVNVQLYYNARFLRLSFIRYLGHQIFSVATFVMVAIFAGSVVRQIFGPSNNIIGTLALTGSIYFFIVVALSYLAPVIFGVRWEDRDFIFNKILVWRQG